VLPRFSWGSCSAICVVFCRSLFFLFFFWPLYCLTFFDVRFLVTPLVSSNFWSSYCLTFFDVRFLVTLLVSSNFWSSYCLTFFDVRLLVTPLVSSNFWPSYCLTFLTYGFWLPLWNLLTFGHRIV
jgi:hypothetical protein